MKRLVLVALVVVAGCDLRLGIPLDAVDAAAPGDDLPIPFAGDLGPGADLARPIPDGATPGGLGWPCDDPSQCQNGTCVDGYCCDSFCAGDPATLCHACNVPGAEGHCTVALAGTDPHQNCEPDAVATCGKDGLCDGAGACRLYAAGTTCGAAACTAGHQSFAPACDGNGTCAPTGGVDCYPYTCNGAVCGTSCTPPAAGCQPPAVCDPTGSCGKRGDGQTCQNGSDCQSGNCAQGVCCDQACTGACVACNLPGVVGTCTPLPGGTQCAPGACSGDATVSPRACDGNGTCLPGTSQSCAPYTCNKATNVCYGRPCVSSQECAAGHTCNTNSGKCM